MAPEAAPSPDRRLQSARVAGALGPWDAARRDRAFLKGLERRLDGICEPEGHDGPVKIIEFQGFGADTAWYNLLAKMGLYGERHPECDVQGIGIFLHERLAPRFPSRIAGEDSPVQAVYLTAATIPQLDAWIDGIFDARSPADLLGPETVAPAH